MNGTYLENKLTTTFVYVLHQDRLSQVNRIFLHWEDTNKQQLAVRSSVRKSLINENQRKLLPFFIIFRFNKVETEPTASIFEEHNSKGKK